MALTCAEPPGETTHWTGRAMAQEAGVSLRSVVLLSAEPGSAQNMPIPCSAFARNAHGGWKVLAPVLLYIDGRPLGPMVGTTIPAGSMPNSINVSQAWK